MFLRCLYNSLSRPEVNELLHLAIELINSSSERKTHIIDCLFGISSNIQIVKIADNGLYFIFPFHFILFFFSFSIFRTTWVRVYQSHCHISHKLMA